MNKVKIIVLSVCMLVFASGLTLQAKLAGKADLVFKNILLNKTKVQQGKMVSVHLSIVKNGDATGAFVIDVYLSKSTNLKSLTADKRMFQISVGALARGRIPINKSKSYKIPVLFKPGRYYVVAVVDPANQVKETSESNNKGHARLTVERHYPTMRRSVDIPKPDLDLEWFSLSDLPPARTIDVTIYFKNKGYQIQVSNQTPSGGWAYIGTHEATFPGTIPPGDERIRINVTITIGRTIPGSAVKFCVKLDPNDALIESDERNNIDCKTYFYR